MQPDTDLHAQISLALTGLVKQIKALRYYPPRHPALQAAAEESLRGFRPLLEGSRPLALTVRKEGFLVGERPLKSHQVLAQLATFCFARRIQALTILPDLSAADLHRFVQCLILDPQEIHAGGGIQAVLERSRITTVWVNETDLAAILQRRKQVEALPPPEETAAEGAESGPQAGLEAARSAKAQTLDLEKLLKQIEQERDDQRFRYQLQELIPLLRLNLTAQHRTTVLRAMTLLCRNAAGQKLSETRRTYALNALGQLTNDEMTDYLVASLFDRSGNELTRDALCQVLCFLADKVVGRLMALLAEETNGAHRKTLADLLVRIGPAALPVLQENLFDERWYVVRNAVVILGEIRSEESLPHLTPLLGHGDIRVRRETIRALTKVGGQRAVAILLQTAESPDQELRRQALLSLGAIRAASALPTLLNLLEQPGWSRRTVDIKKDTMRALGEIGSSDAIPALIRILAQRRLLRRALNDELRVAAATALGDIGDDSARAALEAAVEDRSATVARAAAQALKQLDRELS